MGKGYCFTCKKCGCEYQVFSGVGFLFPDFYRDEIVKIANGEFGSELEEAYEKTRWAVINADHVVYVCNSCKHWSLEIDHTLYAPNDPEKIAKKKYGEKTVEGWGYVPYVFSSELKEDYHVIRRHYQKCEYCRRRMHKATKEETRFLPCPECGEINEEGGSAIYWD